MPRGQRKSLEEKIQAKQELINALNIRIESEERELEELYEIWEEQMSVTGEEIFKQRRSFLSTFIPVFQEFYTYISDGNETVGLSYRSHHEHGELFTQLAEVRERDRILGYSTRGSHKDELEMTLGEYPMKRIG